MLASRGIFLVCGLLTTRHLCISPTFRTVDHSHAERRYVPPGRTHVQRLQRPYITSEPTKGLFGAGVRISGCDVELYSRD
ncbi:hypothetical protein B0T18DRAFT_421625 [Schizothecium vesticola]|uniref:Secreted protein n=1 Tax=Schizothecium vesticola TaxID=314040 RepID=A0AA40BPX1_9PEZI|nr:hypothetical protein B0T18DRAFT_421625 [Schizothecium vesticola]